MWCEEVECSRRRVWCEEEVLRDKRVWCEEEECSGRIESVMRGERV